MTTSPWPFFALVLGWSWLLWIPLAFAGLDLRAFPGLLLFALGGIGPAVAAIALVHLAHGPEAQRDYWRRVIDVRRIGPRWYAVILLIAPAYSALAILLAVMAAAVVAVWGPRTLTGRASRTALLDCLPDGRRPRGPHHGRL